MEIRSVHVWLLVLFSGGLATQAQSVTNAKFDSQVRIFTKEPLFCLCPEIPVFLDPFI